MTRLPNGSPPTPDAFRELAESAFGLLVDEFGFREEAIPFDQDPFLNKVAIWYTSEVTRVVVEGINWGLNARVALGRAGLVTAFENYDLGDLLAMRRPEPAVASRRAARRQAREGQLAQLRQHAVALREVGADVLRGDHTVFPALASRVAARRVEYAAERDRRP